MLEYIFVKIYSDLIFFYKINKFKNFVKKMFKFRGLPRYSSMLTCFLFTAWRLKTVEGVGFEVTGNVTFQKHVFCITEKILITHQQPIEGIKVQILVGYPYNILGYPS